EDRAAPWAAFTLGLAFTNHMTTAMLAPAFLVQFFTGRGVGRAAWTQIARAAPFFVLGLLPYAYLPLRSAQHPHFDWGAPCTLQRFVNHVTGWQFRVWMFSSPQVFAQQSAWFLGRLPWDLAYAGLALAIVGLVVIARRAPRL